MYHQQITGLILHPNFHVSGVSGLLSSCLQTRTKNTGPSRNAVMLQWALLSKTNFLQNNFFALVVQIKVMHGIPRTEHLEPTKSRRAVLDLDVFIACDSSHFQSISLHAIFSASYSETTQIRVIVVSHNSWNVLVHTSALQGCDQQQHYSNGEGEFRP